MDHEPRTVLQGQQHERQRSAAGDQALTGERRERTQQVREKAYAVCASWHVGSFAGHHRGLSHCQIDRPS